jgi:ribonuclease HII
MAGWHKIFPKYGFDIHKGYGTAVHYRAIKKHGMCEIHRRSYLKKIE